MARQAGMTLIELTVVLLVLIGLAGLMIPYVSGFMSKTHDSTGTNNVAALNTAIYRFQGEKMRLPDGLQTLVEGGTGTNVDEIYLDMMNDAQFTAEAIGMPGQMSLSMAGIQTAYNMRDTDVSGSATFAAANTEVTIGMGTVMASLNPATAGSQANLQKAFGGVLSNYKDYDGSTGCAVKYIAMGVGQESEMIGKTISEAPLHFASQGDMGPESKYNRFVVVLRVDDDNAASFDASGITLDDGSTGSATQDCSAMVPAQFVGSAMAMSQDHLFGLSHSLSHTYENMAE